MKKAILLTLLSALMAMMTPVKAAECRKTGQICVDGPSTKNISGVPVYRACWQYQDTYECVAPDTIDFCAGIRQIAGCNQVNSVCVETAFNGECLKYKNTYRCGDAVTPPSGVIQLDNSYTVVTDTIDRSQCSTYENNPSCTLAQKICTEPGGTRIINGLPVNKDCWKWEETYTCIAQNYQNYCIPLRQAGCTEVSNVCKSYAWDNTCNEYDRTYRCDSKQGEPLPQNVTYLDTNYTIIKDQLDTSQCDPHKNNPNCTLASHTCTQPGGTRNINGMDVYKDCWEWTDEYVCASSTLQSDCDELKNNPACSEQSSTCVDSLPDNQCGLLERKFQCKIADGTSKDVTTCANGVCVNGDCTVPNSPDDGDFGQVIAGLETQRQMGLYFDSANGEIFKGVNASCSKKLGGLVNCCKAKGGGAGQGNNVMMQGVKMIANEAISFLGSPYMYDVLYSLDLIPISMLTAIYGPEKIIQSGSSYTFGQGGFDFYGISYTGGTPPFAFDPASFALAIAIQIVMQYLQCNQTEQLLGLRKDQRLCTYVGSWCSSKFLGACITKKEGYCCYNSRLSRIINEQGRSQIGKSYGDPKNPNCSGFTADELSQLDFSKMNLSEFIAEITPKNLNTDLLNQRARNEVEETSQSYFNR